MVDPNHPRLSIVRQCRLVSIARSSFYYTPPTDGGSGLGTAQFCRPPRQSLRPRESHPGVIPGYPGLSREALAKLLADSGTSVRVWVQTGHSGPGHRDRGTDS